MYAWLDVVEAVITRTDFPGGLDHDGLAKAFAVHNKAVKSVIPASQLHIYEVKDGWGALCDFLGMPEPTRPFARTNAREEFWDRVAGMM